MRTILLLPLVYRCLYTIDVCIWSLFAFMSFVVTAWGYMNVCCIAGVVEHSGF